MAQSWGVGDVLTGSGVGESGLADDWVGWLADEQKGWLSVQACN